MPFSVLFVCTGNICRSPAAELLFRARVGAAGMTVPILVGSAGTSGLSGRGMDAASARALRALGVDPSGHAARRVSPAMVAGADLVLTADAGHRSVVVRGEPAAFRRTFAMREFARLGAALPLLDGDPGPSALRARVREIAGQRGLVDAARPGADDIADPFGAGVEVARASVRAVSGAVDAVIRALGVGRVADTPDVGDSADESPRP